MLHGDGSWAKSDELRTGGFILSEPLRAEARARADPAIAALADLKGELPNSAARSAEIAGAIGFVKGALNAGVSVTRHTALYGVPIRFSLERAIEYIDADELVEATPQNIRLRKRILDANARKRAAKGVAYEDRSNRG